MKSKVFRFIFFLMFSIFFFSGCSLPEEDRSKIVSVLELREHAMNTGDIKSYRALLSDSFDDLDKHMEQIRLRNQYLKDFLYIFTSTQVAGVSNFGKKADIEIEFYLTYKRPDDVAPYVWIDRIETVSFVKDSVGWRISGVDDRENSGTMIKPEVVQGIYHALDTRIASLNTGDIELFKTVVANDCPGRKDILSNFAANEEVFSDINYELEGRIFLFISPKMDEARLEQSYSLSFKIKGTEDFEKFKNQKEIISLRKNTKDSTWVITDGLK